jgi:MFS transporter, PHS family, inorganic phosphate transporter
MGVGIGGDYPLSAVISSEFASTRIRGRMMTVVFAAQGWGNFGVLAWHLRNIKHWLILTAGALVGFILVVAYKNSILHDDPAVLHHVDYIWRILIGLGCIPACIALYFRLTIPETPRFTMDIERDVRRAAADIQNVLAAQDPEFHPDAAVQRAEVPKATWADFRQHFSRWENGSVLFGTAYSWFAVDVCSSRVFSFTKSLTIIVDRLLRAYP